MIVEMGSKEALGNYCHPGLDAKIHLIRMLVIPRIIMEILGNRWFEAMMLILFTVVDLVTLMGHILQK